MQSWISEFNLFLNSHNDLERNIVKEMKYSLTFKSAMDDQTPK